MNKLPLALLIASALAGSVAAAPGPQVAPVAWLLMQIRTGESTNKYDLVQQSLYGWKKSIRITRRCWRRAFVWRCVRAIRPKRSSCSMRCKRLRRMTPPRVNLRQVCA